MGKLLLGALFVAGLAKAHGEGRLEARLMQLSKPKLLIPACAGTSELGYLPFEPNAAHLFFQLVSRRYERRSMLITANQPFGEWGRIFPDQAMTLASIDRLVHHATILEMNVESYRRRAALDRKRSKKVETSET